MDRIKPAVQQRATTSSDDLARAPLGSSGVVPLVHGTLRTRSEIAEAAQRVDAGIAGIDEARAGYFPELSAGVVSGLAGEVGSGARFEVTGTQLVYDFGKTGRTVTREVLASQGEHMQFLEVVDTELAASVKTYWTIQSYIQQQAIAAEQLQTMQELEALSQSRSAEGIISNADLLEARRRVQSAQTILLQKQLELQAAERRLAQLAGLAGAIRVNDPGGIGLICRDEKVDDALSPQVQLAAVQKAIAEIDLRNAEKARLPAVSVEAVAGQDMGGRSSGGNDVGMNLKVDTSVFGGGFGSRKIIAAKNAEAAGAALAAARQDIALEYDDAVANMAGQRVLIASLEKEADMLNEARDTYRRQFLELGSRTLEDVLDIENDYYTSLRDLAATRTDLELSQVDCVKSTGLLRARLGLAGKFLHGIALSL